MPGQLVEFAVDVDADRLEAARRRVPAGLGAHDRGDDVRQFRGAAERPALACGADRPRDPARRALFAEILENPRDHAFGGSVEPVGRGRARARIHPHVERAVGAETEAACRVVELRRGNTDVEQHAVHAAGGVMAFEHLAEPGETFLLDRET